MPINFKKIKSHKDNTLCLKNTMSTDKKLLNKKARNFVFTWNNYDQDESNIDPSKIDEYFNNFKYLIIGCEIAPNTGTPHLQGYISFVNQRTLNGLIKTYSKNISWQIAYADDYANQKYCSKEGNFYEFGNIPPKGKRNNQGKRNDLVELKDKLLSGSITVEKIREINPEIYHQYGRTLDKLEDDFLLKKRRTTTCRGIWYFGPTGTGKSHRAFNFSSNEDDIYIHSTRDKGWWDNFTHQPITVFNEFRGAIDYDELLTLTDKWNYYVPRRCKKPICFTSDFLIITSSLPPNKVYKKRNKQDKLDQLLRRFEIYQVVDQNPENDIRITNFPEEDEEQDHNSIVIKQFCTNNGIRPHVIS